MKTPELPVNVVIYSDSGKADNYDCTGPEQLKAWLQAGTVNSQTRVFARRVNKWMTVECYLGWADRKSDTENLCDMDATLSNLVGVAEELKRLTALAKKRDPNYDRPRDFSEHRKAVRADGDADRNNDHNGAAVCLPITGAGTY